MYLIIESYFMAGTYENKTGFTVENLSVYL